MCTCESASTLCLKVGEMMAEFPLDPQLAKMIVAAPELKCDSWTSVLIVVSVSVMSPQKLHFRTMYKFFAGSKYPQNSKSGVYNISPLKTPLLGLSPPPCKYGCILDQIMSCFRSEWYPM